MQNFFPAKAEQALHDENELSRLIPLLMSKLGIPSHLKGYNYLTLAVNLVYNDPTLIHSVTTGLYRIIADAYNTTASCVERNMRTALKAAIDSGKPILFDNYFASILTASNGIPPRGFIAALSEKLRHNLILPPAVCADSLG